jgi:hypothetical protein
VRLVDHEQRDGALEQHLEELAVAEALGRDVQDVAAARGDGLVHGARLARGEVRVHRERVDALRLQLVLLVLHERDERAHHHREPLQHQRRELVDERLAAARGHDDERVAPPEHLLDRLELAELEVVEAEPLGEDAPARSRDRARARFGVASAASAAGGHARPRGRRRWALGWWAARRRRRRASVTGQSRERDVPGVSVRACRRRGQESDRGARATGAGSAPSAAAPARPRWPRRCTFHGTADVRPRLAFPAPSGPDGAPDSLPLPGEVTMAEIRVEPKRRSLAWLWALLALALVARSPGT